MRTAYSNLIEIENDDYEVYEDSGGTIINITPSLTLAADMVRFNIRGSDIFIEFTDDGVIQLKNVPIKHRARLVRERLIRLIFDDSPEILATMPMF